MNVTVVTAAHQAKRTRVRLAAAAAHHRTHMFAASLRQPSFSPISSVFLVIFVLQFFGPKIIFVISDHFLTVETCKNSPLLFFVFFVLRYCFRGRLTQTLSASNKRRQLCFYWTCLFFVSLPFLSSDYNLNAFFPTRITFGISHFGRLFIAGI